MKTLLLAAFTAVAGLLAIPAASAQDAAVLPIGKTFTFTVKRVVSSKSDSNGFTPSGVPIPTGIPKYKPGDKIKFTINPKGELQWPDRKLPVYGDYPLYIAYGKLATFEKPYPDIAHIYVNANLRPTKAEIYFYKKKSSGAVHTVFYELK
ncbi:MAG: hypothetical protein V4689_07240 [Verrucomicrobiota bacterium]